MKLNNQQMQVVRARKGLTSKDLATRYGCTVSRINYLLSAESVRTDTAGKLARALGVDVSEIIVQ